MTSESGRLLPRGRVGLATIADAVGNSALDVEAIASLIGYERDCRDQTVAAGRATMKAAARDVSAKTENSDHPPRAAALPYWRVETAKFTAVVGDSASVEKREVPFEEATISTPLDPEATTPATEPLLPWRSLGPRLRKNLRKVLRGGIDDSKLVEELAQAKPLIRAPRLTRSVWDDRTVVLVDRSLRLVPAWMDQRYVTRRLLRVLGRRAEIRLVREGGLTVECADLARSIAPDTKVLALTDLGVYSGASTRREWLDFGRILKRRDAVPIALVPCPKGRIPKPLRNVWRIEIWDRTDGLRSHSAGEADGRAMRLIGLVSPASRIESGLLRAVRHLLPVKEADVGTEFDAWLHPSVRASHSWAMSLREEVTKSLRRAFGDDVDDSYKRRAIAALRTWRLACPREMWFEELISVASTPGSALRFGVAEAEWEQARDFFLGLAEAVSSSRLSKGLQPAVRDWFRLAVKRLPQTTRKNKPVDDALSKLERELLDEFSTDISAKVGGGEPRWYELYQTPAGLSVSDDSETQSPLGRIWSAEAMTARLRIASIDLDLDSGKNSVELDQVESVVLDSGYCQLTLAPFRRPPWATAAGRDRYGLWADASIAGVTHRFRWIPPGRFRMGSPESEDGRWDDSESPQFDVTISKGFWLGETPCTQELWSAATGENPSHFKSLDRPVEQVSWEDCSDFVTKLNDLESTDEYRMPTEAEWEYACRAATETSTYAGELEVLGECNGPILDEIAWYSGNSGVEFDLENGYDSSDWPNKQFDHKQAGSRVVRQKKPNEWGLYDMLGNVWEWVSDWYGSYSGEHEVDPAGPAEGSNRVCRGRLLDQPRQELPVCGSRQRAPGRPELRPGLPPCPRSERSSQDKNKHVGVSSDGDRYASEGRAQLRSTSEAGDSVETSFRDDTCVRQRRRQSRARPISRRPSRCVDRTAPSRRRPRVGGLRPLPRRQQGGPRQAEGRLQGGLVTCRIRGFRETARGAEGSG